MADPHHPPPEGEMHVTLYRTPFLAEGHTTVETTHSIPVEEVASAMVGTEVSTEVREESMGWAELRHLDGLRLITTSQTPTALLLLVLLLGIETWCCDYTSPLS